MSYDDDSEWVCSDCVRDRKIDGVKTIGRLMPKPCSCGRGLAVNWVGSKTDEEVKHES